MSSSPVPADDISLSKKEWRERFQSYRRSLPAPLYRARSAVICCRVFAHSAIAQASTVHLYWPLLDQREVDTRPLIQALRGLGTTVVLPVVTSYDPESPTMEHRRYEGPSSLTTNRWGIREPTQTERVPPSALDAVVVPALGADQNGNRIGHGSGYYDAFLETVTAPRILPIYSACVVSSVPTDDHDVPMTALVTERRRASAQNA